jgi:hypothetical protein
VGDLCEKTLSLQVPKNAQIQGDRDAFHLPISQAILCREQFETVPYNVAAMSLPRA